ncbi:MAG: sulfatase-like hydrolase/transferase, partial [Clostridia bacterium]
MKKNVMVILCDQFRADYISCYNENSPVKTPNIDALVEDGVMFQNAVTASPVCAPGRACMMTGRYVSDHGVWTNDVAFRDGIEFLPQRMTDNGYACAAFGKLHHYPAKDSKGFDYAWQMEESRLGEEDDYYKYLHSIHKEVNGVFPDRDKFIYSEEEYYENQIAIRAIDFIESVKDEKNFFTWVSFQGPHGPLDPPEIDYNVDLSLIEEPLEPDFVPPCEVTKYRRARGNDCNFEEIRKYRESYVKLIEHIDNQVARIVEYLKENNLYENTVIMFSTDHGDMCGDYRMWQKGPFLYSNQLEVPLIIANHQDLPKNVKTNMLTGNIDIAKTALSLAGDNNELGYSKDIAKMYND